MECIKGINNHTRETYNKIADKYFTLFKDEMSGKIFDRDLLDNFSENFNESSLICDAGCL